MEKEVQNHQRKLLSGDCAVKNKMVCGPNDTPFENIGNATSDIDEDSGRIEEGHSYGEKLEMDLDAMRERMIEEGELER